MFMCLSCKTLWCKSEQLIDPKIDLAVPPKVYCTTVVWLIIFISHEPGRDHENGCVCVCNMCMCGPIGSMNQPEPTTETNFSFCADLLHCILLFMYSGLLDPKMHFGPSKGKVFNPLWSSCFLFSNQLEPCASARLVVMPVYSWLNWQISQEPVSFH